MPKIIGTATDGFHLQMDSAVLSQPDLTTDLIREIISKIPPPAPNVKSLAGLHVVNLRRIIAKNPIVSTTEAESVFYARLKGRRWFSKFAIGIEPQDCSFGLVILTLSNRIYRITAAICSDSLLLEPDSFSRTGPQAIQRSFQFWQNKALSLELMGGEAAIDMASKTTECPWKLLETA